MLAAYWNEKREFEGFWLAIVKRIEKGAFTLEWFEAPEYPAFKIPPKNIAERPDITMPELAGALAAATGQRRLPPRSRVGSSGPAIASKKTLRASEQDRADIKQAREEWTNLRQPRMRLEPHRLVFIDETATTTKMTRLRGRCPKGQRLLSKAPFGHWKTQTFIAALR